MAMPTLLGAPSFPRRTRPSSGEAAWPVLLSPLAGGFEALFRTDLTSLSTSIDTGYRGSPDASPTITPVPNAVPVSAAKTRTMTHPSL